MNTSIVTRIAPSPTGHLHIGTVRTALFNFLFARRNGGTFIIRSEDTDRARSTKEFEDGILEGLAWLGISHDKFFRQSERAQVHAAYLTRLIDEGSAYLSREESKQNPGETVEVVRLKNPGKEITFRDEIRGDITFDTAELGDMVIARSIDDPLYHFAVVADDMDAGVTHVIRGEDHISNTPRQILIQEALRATRPVYAHLPLILAPDRSKMSKRHGSVAIAEYRSEGFLKEAIVNYLALLGWNPGTEQEIFSIEELVGLFSLDGVQKGGAVFDRTKFEWFNKAHLAKIDDATYLAMVQAALPARVTALPQYDTERLERFVPVIRERVHTMKEVTEAGEAGEYDFAFAAPQVSAELLKWKKDERAADALPRLLKAIELLKDADFSSPDSIKAALWPYAEEVGRGELLWPLRVALTGRKESPDPFVCSHILGREQTISRVKTACDTIQA